MSTRKEGRTSKGCGRCDPAKLPGSSPVFPFERPSPMPADRAKTAPVDAWPTPSGWPQAAPKQAKSSGEAAAQAAGTGAARPTSPKETGGSPAQNISSEGSAASVPKRSRTGGQQRRSNVHTVRVIQ